MSNSNTPLDLRNNKPAEDLRVALGRFINDLTNLQEGIDREGLILWIKNNKRMRGANAWMLMCSIMIASLGLDLDSPAIIIGAMLISPLMSPILGVGMGIGTNDKESLLISLKHFGVAIAIALITSYLYFLLNPLGQESATKEIIDRTEPTLLAGIVAIFGGIAGIISSSRKEQSSAMPGVAIATALMPPLCVAGFGLARSEMIIFLNAFYLFFLNSFFIAISSFVMIRYMKFPFKTYPDQKESRRTTLTVVIVSIILVIPSILILREAYIERQYDQKIASFIETNFGEESNPQCLGYSFTDGDSVRVLAIKLLGKQLDQDNIKSYERQLAEAGLPKIKIYPLQDEALDLQAFDRLQKELAGYGKIVKQLELSDAEKDVAQQEIAHLKNQLHSIQRDSLPVMQLNRDLITLLDPIDHVECGYIYSPVNDNNRPKKEVVVYVYFKNGIRLSTKKETKTKVKTFIESRLNKPVKILEGSD